MNQEHKMSDIHNNDISKKDGSRKRQSKIPHSMKKTFAKRKPFRIQRKRKFLKKTTIPDSVFSELIRNSADLEKATKKLINLKENYESYKKRVEREKGNTIKLANEKLLLDFLPTLDHLELAIQSAKNTHNHESLINGIEMIQKQFLEYLESNGLKQINALGESFDPAFHEAVAKEERNDVPEHTIIEELRKGFQLFDKVIRPSMVKISEKKSD